MARPERYFIGPGVRDKLTETFIRLNLTPVVSSTQGRIPTRSQPMQQGAGGESIRLGKTSAAWNKGTVATINVWEDGTPPNETHSDGVSIENCINKFANVATDKWVVVARAGNGRYYLIAAEC